MKTNLGIALAVLALLAWTAATAVSDVRAQDYRRPGRHEPPYQADIYASLPHSFPNHGTAVVTAAADLIDPGYATVPVYRVILAERDLAYAQELADRFGIDGTPRKDRRTLVTFESSWGRRGSPLVVFPLVGGFQCQMQHIPFYMAVPPLLPTDESAVATAIGFLTEHDLMPEGVSGVATVIRNVLATNDGEEGFPVAVNVGFLRDIGGLEVVGPGQQMGVTVGEDGVAGIVHIWPELEFYEDVPAKPLDAALADLRAGLHASPWQHRPEATQMVVQKAELKLWIGDHKYMQRFASPVYEISGVYLDADGNVVEPFTEYCDAAA